MLFENSRQSESEVMKGIKKAKMSKSIADSKSPKKPREKPVISDLSNGMSIGGSKGSVLSSDQDIIEEERKGRRRSIGALPHEVELSGEINSPHSSDKQMKIPYSDGISRSNSIPSFQQASLAEGSSMGQNKLIDKKLFDNSPRPNLINVLENSLAD